MKKLNGSLDLLNETGYDSPNLFKEVRELQPHQIARTQLGLQWVVDNGLQNDVAIIGGTAVASHLQVPRPLTPDLDFIVRDLRQISGLLDQQKIAYKPLEFLNETHVGVGVPQFDADFMMLTDHAFNELILKHSAETRIGGGIFRVVTKEMLVVMKMLTGRSKDLEDGVKLIQCIKTNGSTECLRDLVKTVRSQKHVSKDQYNDLQSFIW